MSTRIASLALTQQGVLPKLQEIDRASSAFIAALDRWEHLRPSMRGKTWSQSPAEMVADLVRGIAQDMITEYGPWAWVKATQMLAGITVNPEFEDISFNATWPQANASVKIALSLVPHRSHELGLELEPVSPENADPAKVLEKALSVLAEGPTRLALDPISGLLPAGCVAAVAVQAERHFPGNDQDMNVLVATAAVLLVWQNMETMGATTGALTITGLTQNEIPLAPGHDVCLTAEAVLMDTSLLPTPSKAEQALCAMVVRHRRGS